MKELKHFLRTEGSPKIYIYKVVPFVCVCVCVYNSPTAHTNGPIMTKPGMMMVPHLGMVHTIFQGLRSKVIAYVYILSYSPHHWTDHDQTWHDDGPPPRDGAHHFPRSRSKVKVIAYVYILSYSPHHWTDHDQTWHDDGPQPRDSAHHFSRSRS